MLTKDCIEHLEELRLLLTTIEPEDYREISPVFKTSSIGQHVRHILEFFTCLIEQYPGEEICYDRRVRSLTLESDPRQALATLAKIQNQIGLPDRELTLIWDLQQPDQSVKTTYFRELWYNLEHCIHHQALIKLACHSLMYLDLSESFGVAKSTRRHQQVISN